MRKPSRKTRYDDGGSVDDGSLPEITVTSSAPDPNQAGGSDAYGPPAPVTTSYDPGSASIGLGNTVVAPSGSGITSSSGTTGTQGSLAKGVSSLLSGLGLNSSSNLAALQLLAKLGAAATGAKGNSTGTAQGGTLKTKVPSVAGQGTGGSSATNGQGYGPDGKGYSFVNYLTSANAPKANIPQNAYYTYGQGAENNFGVSSPGHAYGGSIKGYDSGGVVPAQPTPMGGMLSGQPMNTPPPPGPPGQNPAGPQSPVPQTPSTIPSTPQVGAVAQPGAPSAGRPVQPPNGINSVTGAPRIGSPLQPAQQQQPAQQATAVQPAQHPYGASGGPYGGPAARMADGGGVHSNDPYGAAQTPGVSRHIKGAGDGTSDSIPAKLASGEYVIDAQGVSMLGNGDNDAGAKKLDEFRKNLRAHKGKALSKGRMAPDAKTIQAYMPKGYQ